MGKKTAAHAVTDGQFKAAKTVQSKLVNAAPSFDLTKAKMRNARAAYALQKAQHAKSGVDQTVVELAKEIEIDVQKEVKAAAIVKGVQKTVTKAVTHAKQWAQKEVDNAKKIKEAEKVRAKHITELEMRSDKQEMADRALARAKAKAYKDDAEKKTQELVAKESGPVPKANPTVVSQPTGHVVSMDEAVDHEAASRQMAQQADNNKKP